MAQITSLKLRTYLDVPAILVRRFLLEIYLHYFSKHLLKALSFEGTRDSARAQNNSKRHFSLQSCSRRKHVTRKIVFPRYFYNLKRIMDKRRLTKEKTEVMGEWNLFGLKKNYYTVQHFLTTVKISLVVLLRLSWAPAALQLVRGKREIIVLIT